jgi:hypothetical protein
MEINALDRRTGSGSTSFDIEEEKIETQFEPGEDWIDHTEKAQPSTGFTAAVFSENWPDSDNLDARILEVGDEFVKLDVLLDRASRQIETRVYRRELLEGAVTLEAGNYVLVRIFRGRGKIKFTFNNGNDIVDKEVFENLSRFDDLEDFNFDRVLE